MQDIIYGLVDSVIDGDTFIINVTEASSANQFKYNRWERIRIAQIDAEELNTIAGERDKTKLEGVILGVTVRCSVYSRDTLGRVVAEVKVV